MQSQLIEIEAIRCETPATSKKQVEATAQLLVKTQGYTPKPVVVVQEKGFTFKAVANEDTYHAAVKAAEIDPAGMTEILCIVCDTEEEAELLASM